jgi:DNA-directed RNA polymerase specialized sigma subunit
MDYKREAEERLNNYDNLKISLDNLGIRIRELKSELESIKAMSYSDMPKGGGKGQPDDAVVNKMFELQVARNNYSETRKEVNKIETIISRLPEYEQKLIKAYYLEGLRGDSLLKETNCANDRQLYRDKAKAIKTLAIQLFGIKVIY